MKKSLNELIWNEAVEHARQAGRDAALEEAAQVACEFVVALDLSGLRWDAHITIAEAIRALKTDPNWAEKVTDEALALLNKVKS